MYNNATGVKCAWCGSTAVKAVKQPPYVHFICKNQPACSHEWDAVLDEKTETEVINKINMCASL